MRYNTQCKYIMETKNTTITKVCGVTNNEYNVTVPTPDYLKWKNGELIQNVFPDMDCNEREFLISGFTPDEWDDMFPEDELDFTDPAGGSGSHSLSNSLIKIMKDIVNKIISKPFILNFNITLEKDLDIKFEIGIVWVVIFLICLL